MVSEVDAGQLLIYTWLDGRVDRIQVLVAQPFGAGGPGGIDRLMDELADELAATPRDGIDVTFMASRGNSSILLSPFYLSLFLARMCLMRLSKDPLVVHINLATKGSVYRKLAIARAASLVGARYVVHLHGGGFPEYFADSKQFLKKRMTRFFRDARRIVVLGSNWRDYVLQTFSVPEEQVTIVQNAVRCKPYSSPQSSHDGIVRIVFLGRIEDLKGVPQLVQALDSVQSLPEPWEAVLAGDGEVDSTKAKVSRLGLSSRVALPGWVDAAEADKLLNACDVVVLPSLMENLPMVVIEGMAHGRAVIATSVGANPEIIRTDETGILVAPGDVEGLSVALQSLIQDTALRQQIGLRAREFQVENLEFVAYTDKLCDLWRECAR